jgi:hypothetical protein
VSDISLWFKISFEICETNPFQVYSTQVLILLAGSPANNKDALLSIAREPRKDLFWVAACNLLTEVSEVVSPNLEIRITDLRGNKKYQLPEISGVTVVK